MSKLRGGQEGFYGSINLDQCKEMGSALGHLVTEYYAGSLQRCPSVLVFGMHPHITVEKEYPLKYFSRGGWLIDYCHYFVTGQKTVKKSKWKTGAPPQ